MRQHDRLQPSHSREDRVQLETLIRPHLSAKKDRHLVHKIFSYPAKFQSYLPSVLIEHLTAPGDLVCDPYSGGGTTSAATALLNRRGYAIDMNPIAVLVSRAKTTRLSSAKALKTIEQLKTLAPRKRSALCKEEWELMGTSLGGFVESVWDHVRSSRRDSASPLIAALLIKRIKLACRRDKTHLRTASFEKHLAYLIEEFQAALEGFQESEGFGQIVIDRGSNHEMDLASSSVDLIVTSPPYPGVDVEYNLIQLQRRDLGKCYRSDVGVRIAESVLGKAIPITKKDLCDGGSAGSYWTNTAKSLREMRRVLKKDALAFLYIGFKTEIDRARFEKLVKDAGFKIFDRFVVELGKERVASSRGLFHGRDTAMMECDQLYVLRPQKPA